VTDGTAMFPPADEAFYAALIDDDPETLYERAPCGYLSTTPDGVIVKANETFTTLTGHAREALVGQRTFSSLLSPGGRIYHDTHYAPMLRMQQQVREIALDIVRADGERLPVLVNAALDLDTEGRPLVVRIAVFDATERRRYEKELLKAKERAEASEQRARALAMTLQQTLIPPSPPQIPGLDVAASYRPAGLGEEVGGDFYDVFQIAEDDWVVTLGDVCGKGVEAAVVTALVRHTLRALAVRMHSPAETLRTLNEVLLHHPTDRFCTVALLRLRRANGTWHLTYALGGHPPPLLLRKDAAPIAVCVPGTLIGVLPVADVADTEMEVAPGSTLVLFTDGVTEGRRDDEQYGDERLSRLLTGLLAPEDVTAAVLDDVLAFQGGRARDDIAVVSLGVPPDR
jgi:phosphoserine phosphatase RsbU/P